MAQGAGNAICGLLGKLPMTAVIVRSAADVPAGARTKASPALHFAGKGAGLVEARQSGNATLLRLPRILDGLEALPQDRPVERDL